MLSAVCKPWAARRDGRLWGSVPGGVGAAVVPAPAAPPGGPLPASPIAAGGSFPSASSQGGRLQLGKKVHRSATFHWVS